MRNIYQNSKLQGPYSKYLRLINISALNLYIMIDLMSNHSNKLHEKMELPQ